jgi:transposase
MNGATIHEGVRRMRFSSLLERQERGEITQEEAADLLGVTARTFQRWAGRYTAEGEEGLADRRCGKVSPRRAPEAELERMLGLYRDKYADFTVKHFHEKLVARHNYKLGYTVTKLHLHASGVVQPAKSRSAHRKKRARRSLPGMMLHQDGSRHVWIEGLAPLDLIVTMDDATSKILSAFLVEEEGTASTFRGLREVVEKHGLFCEFYTDRGSHYFYTPEAGGKVSKTELTQVGRALSQLSIKHIAAYSPEARGRSERMFRTLQDRLPKEFRLDGITTVEAANAWLAETGIAAFNARFEIEPEEPGTAFVPDTKGLWREALCIVEERTVAKDNTVAWNGRHLQLPESRLRPHFVRATVRVHAYPDGTTSVHLGPHRLADYTEAGALTEATDQQQTPRPAGAASCSERSAGALKSAASPAPARDAAPAGRKQAGRRTLLRSKAIGDVQRQIA